MTSKLVPADPSKSMVIRNVTPNIKTFSLPFSRFGTIKVGGRATLVKLTSGALAVFSPVALTPEVKEAVAGFGNNLKYIIAPDIEHHIFVSAWASAYEGVHLIGPEGLPEKRLKNKEVSHVPFSTVFKAASKSTQRITEEFDADFEYEFVDAHPNKELVFYYKPDKTLIEADLLFNLPATEQYSKAGESGETGAFTKLFGALQNTSGTAIWQKRVQWYLFSKGDRPSYNASLARIAGWDFERIIPCHGDVMEDNAKGIFLKVFEWHLQGKKGSVRG